MYAKACGLTISPQSRVIATGGASANKAILQVIADVFNAAVYVTDVPNSAALGGCYRALYALQPEGTSFSAVITPPPERQPVCVCQPSVGSQQVYSKMLDRYKMLEERVTKLFMSHNK
ncbi:hypothetical protein DPMN_056831 [Dreissena polymorpha]|uniref:Carbohydrate kinase FGGY C-terminal domain-containing protein n=2 Tax=Dreissena polymorpha TaxID=45954 RepID=A0A9D4CSF3_DREPO|nr:hypothetical protein DPMN_056831 [Dreissena polymorpha]